MGRACFISLHPDARARYPQVLCKGTAEEPENEGAEWFSPGLLASWRGERGSVMGRRCSCQDVSCWAKVRAAQTIFGGCPSAYEYIISAEPTCRREAERKSRRTAGPCNASSVSSASSASSASSGSPTSSRADRLAWPSGVNKKRRLDSCVSGRHQTGTRHAGGV